MGIPKRNKSLFNFSSFKGLHFIGQNINNGYILEKYNTTNVSLSL